MLACKTEKKADTSASEEPQKSDPIILSPEEKQGMELLENCLKAHGGMDIWKSFVGLEYNLNDNGKQVYQLTHLKDRRAYLKSKKYEVGFDGKVAWAVPNANEVSGKSAAFYYNLDFYFIGVPFLLKDPGVNISYAGKTKIDDRTFESLKVTFGSEVGLTPEDVYYLYINPETYLMEILTYSISYFDKENSVVSSAKVYSDYKKVQGLMMPHKMENFEWNDGAMGKSKNHLRIFSDIQFLKEISNEEVFEVPQDAVIERLEV
ncbi:hypothetical protein D7Z94_23355 [Ulvibacterium marinum]|uniref:Outer membrane lipoprotein-sorting protein n=1 Tax=Ulvibacterium marinum TaxID=2419782 RepID=A0A3B0BV27_9FLAO|nr:hypothetical protein D7Z94_23355 [Ulvibacterium marinum]